MNKLKQNDKIGALPTLILTLFLSVFFTANLHSQNTLYGKVKAAESSDAIFKAEITNSFYESLAFTDEAGAFRFESSTDFVIVYCLKEGYKTVVDTLFANQENEILLEKLDITLTEIKIQAEKENQLGIGRMKSVEGYGIYAGKKTEVISMRQISANLATNNARQVFAKVPGFNIWESDCAGLQLGVGGRGLSPNRSANFNMRQNGYDISADPMGYPESYYAPPMQAIERIEVVRGAAGLQFGSQFGGLVNFILKKGEEGKPIGVESIQTYGSNQYFNSYNAIGGETGRLNYYAYYQYRQGDCWRCNSGFQMHAASARLEFKANERLKIRFEHTFLTYLAQQAGGLTDRQFEQDAQASYRERNWFQIKWNLTAADLDFKISDKSKWNIRLSGLFAERNAVGYLGRPLTLDVGENRDLLLDQFNYFALENRFVHRYTLLGNQSTFLIGNRIYRGQLEQQQGLANADSTANFDLLNPDEPYYLSYKYPGVNIALFAENVFNLSPKWSVTPGVRFEYLASKSAGFYFSRAEDLAGNLLFEEKNEESDNRRRSFFLLGLGTAFRPSSSLEIYSNISQNFRPIGYNDLRVVNENLVIDSLLTDEKGFNADLGLRANLKGGAVNFDASVFYLGYNNKIGNVSVTVVDSSSIAPVPRIKRLRTNVSQARMVGIELFGEIEWVSFFQDQKRKPKHHFSTFLNIAVIHGRYIASDEPAFDGKEVEYVPPLNLKSGVQYRFIRPEKYTISLGGQVSFVEKHFTDATNAEFTPTAIEGIVPSYAVLDLNARFDWKKVHLELSVNNLANSKYFTRRATGYPGPGIIPADGRTIYATLGVKI